MLQDAGVSADELTQMLVAQPPTSAGEGRHESGAIRQQPGKVAIDNVPDLVARTGGSEDFRVGGVGLCGSDMSRVQAADGKRRPIHGSWVTRPSVSSTPLGPDVSARAHRSDGCGRAERCLLRLRSMQPRSDLRLCRPAIGGYESPRCPCRAVGCPERVRLDGPRCRPHGSRCASEPTAVAMAALRRLGTALPDTALVIGSGAQGLMMSLVLLERGVVVFADDVNQARIALATDLGCGPGRHRRHSASSPSSSTRWGRRHR